MSGEASRDWFLTEPDTVVTFGGRTYVIPWDFPIDRDGMELVN